MFRHFSLNTIPNLNDKNPLINFHDNELLVKTGSISVVLCVKDSVIECWQAF